MARALLFDLDETLVVEEPAAAAAFAATAQVAAVRHGMDLELLASEARSPARELGDAAPAPPARRGGGVPRVGGFGWPFRGGGAGGGRPRGVPPALREREVRSRPSAPSPSNRH